MSLLLLMRKASDAALKLWMFYAAEAKKQQTNQPWVRNRYAAEQLNWSLSKVKRCRKELLELNFVETVKPRRDKNTNLFKKGEKWYIRVKHLMGQDKNQKFQREPVDTNPLEVHERTPREEDKKVEANLLGVHFPSSRKSEPTVLKESDVVLKETDIYAHDDFNDTAALNEMMGGGDEEVKPIIQSWEELSHLTDQQIAEFVYACNFQHGVDITPADVALFAPSMADPNWLRIKKVKQPIQNPTGYAIKVMREKKLMGVGTSKPKVESNPEPEHVEEQHEENDQIMIVDGKEVRIPLSEIF